MIVPEAIRTAVCDLCPHFGRPEVRGEDVKAVFLTEVYRPGDRRIFAPNNSGIRICAACLRNLLSMLKRSRRKK